MQGWKSLGKVAKSESGPLRGFSWQMFNGLLSFFINHGFVGVFQYHLRPPKRALGFKKTIKNPCF